MNENNYVQYGCGWSAPLGWHNFDSSPSLRFEQIPLIGRLYTKNYERFPENVEYGDIVAGLPLPDNSCQFIYCSHILEHLAFEDLRKALKNTYKILANGGIFRLVMPDLEYSISVYIADSSPEAAVEFMRTTQLGKEKRVRGLASAMVDWLGNSQHLWMWDYKSIQFELQKAGFTDIRRANFGDSHHYQVFQAVETIERWTNCLGIECKK